MMNKRIIEGKNLVKAYDDTPVVKNIDFGSKKKNF